MGGLGGRALWRVAGGRSWFGGGGPLLRRGWPIPAFAASSKGRRGAAVWALVTARKTAGVHNPSSFDRLRRPCD